MGHDMNRLASQAKTLEAEPITSPTLLLVDRSADFLNLWKARLRGQGFRILTARGSSEALHLARLHQASLLGAIIDLILTPTSLRIAPSKCTETRVHGDRLAELIRQHYPTVGILLTSALSEREMVRHGIHLPTTKRFPFLRKPIDENELQVALHAIVAARTTSTVPGHTAARSAA